MYSRLQMERLITRLRAAGRIAGTVAMLTLWVGLVGVSSSAQLHHLLHPDSHQASHDCAVSQVAKGQFLAAAGAITVVAVLPVPTGQPVMVTELFLPQPQLRFFSPRGPPFASLPLQ